jgi:copper(I)-binding protein
MNSQTTKRLLAIIFLTGCFLNACSAATGIRVSSAWARPALRNSNRAVYFLLQKHSAARDDLTGVSSEAAVAAEIHESKMAGDEIQITLHFKDHKDLQVTVPVQEMAPGSDPMNGH